MQWLFCSALQPCFSPHVEEFLIANAHSTCITEICKSLILSGWTSLMHGSGGEMEIAEHLLANSSNKCFLVITLLWHYCEHLPFTSGVFHGHGAPQMAEKTQTKTKGWNLVPDFKTKTILKKISSFKAMGLVSSGLKAMLFQRIMLLPQRFSSPLVLPVVIVEKWLVKRWP